VGIIGIHDDIIASEDLAIFQFHSSALAAGELQFLDGRVPPFFWNSLAMPSEILQRPPCT
jgi:hypothetical protein